MAKKVWASIVAVAWAAVLVIGLLADAPNALQNLAANGPAWVTNPDVWWVGAITLLAAAILFGIWRTGSTSTIPSTEEHLLFRVETAVNRVASELKRCPRKSFGSDDEYRAFIDRTLTIEFENTLGAAIYSLYNATERDKYLQVVRKARNEHDPTAIQKAATAYLGSFIMARSCAKLDAARDRHMKAVKKN